MSSSKSKNSELITSRITVTFFAFALLSLLSWIYILPFKKHYLVINNYYQVIETVVISAAFILALLSVIYLIMCKKKNTDLTEKLITPQMLTMYCLSLFAAAVIIPLSNNRTLTYKYCIAAFFAVFLAYMLYYVINKGFAVYTALLAAYCIIFAFLDYMYTSNVTFSDKISMPYTTFLMLFLAFIVICNTALYFISKKKAEINIIYVCTFSAVSFIAVIIRFFVTRYVSVISVILLIILFVLIILKEKKILKVKK